MGPPATISRFLIRRHLRRPEPAGRDLNDVVRRFNTVAIIGVGLIGGSVGLALRKRKLAKNVVGIGRRTSSLNVARRRGAVTKTTTDLARGVREAELVVVCSPVECIVEHVLAAAAHCPDNTLVTDTGSIKGQIVRALDAEPTAAGRFVGCHPLAGSEKQGPGEAVADLFEGRLVIVTPGRRTRPDDTRRICTFWKSLGATVSEMSPKQHDRVVAATSHAPHLFAAALAGVTSPKLLPYAASGFRDTTRVAAGDPELWTQIMLANRDNVLDALGDGEKCLTALRQALETSDRTKLRKLLEKGKRHRDALGC